MGLNLVVFRTQSPDIIPGSILEYDLTPTRGDIILRGVGEGGFQVTGAPIPLNVSLLCLSSIDYSNASLTPVMIMHCDTFCSTLSFQIPKWCCSWRSINVRQAWSMKYAMGKVRPSRFHVIVSLSYFVKIVRTEGNLSHAISWR